MTVQELLRAHVVTIPPDATIRDMVDLFDLYQVLLLPVVDENDLLLGSIYEEQVMSKVFANEVPALRESSRRSEVVAQSDGITARMIMFSPPAAVDEGEDALEALERMSESGLTRLPVTSAGKVIGTVSRVDICQALLEGEL